MDLARERLDRVVLRPPPRPCRAGRRATRRGSRPRRALACSTVNWYSLDHDMPPNSTAAARSIRSIQSPSVARKTITLPRSSVITAGFGEMPAISIVTCGISGTRGPSRRRRRCRQAEPGGPHERDDAVRAADLGRHQRDDRPVPQESRPSRAGGRPRRRSRSSRIRRWARRRRRRASGGHRPGARRGRRAAPGPWSSTAWSEARSPISVSPPRPRRGSRIHARAPASRGVELHGADGTQEASRPYTSRASRSSHEPVLEVVARTHSGSRFRADRPPRRPCPVTRRTRSPDPSG